jgi:hypothetical protein
MQPEHRTPLWRDPWLWGGVLLLGGAIYGTTWYLDQRKAAEDAQNGESEAALVQEDKPAEPSRDDTPAENDNAFGYLTVKVKGSRSAKVYVDGKSVGKAPVNLLRVPAGAHTIKVETKARKRTRSKTKRVTVTKKNTRKSPQIVTVSP